MVYIDMISKQPKIGRVTATFLPQKNYKSDGSLTNLTRATGANLEGGMGGSA